MILTHPGYSIMSMMDDDPLRLIEKAGRTCYKSEDKITKESAKKFVQKINKLGHESVIEHSAMTVLFICDRGVSHELVRHRLCAFSQESTRYCNYKGGVTFIIPPWLNLKPGEYTGGSYIEGDEEALLWLGSIFEAEDTYKRLLKIGWSPQQARSVLPNALKTEIVVTANFREWKHIFNLRCSSAAHPQIRELMTPLRDYMRLILPEIFE